ncbi:MAG: hypothetical protein OXC29_29655 [Rhodococcus sp.]|nr:hypothetical protein [Rhodococcus sp. (in: high G+C Gram-positive bacteria)]
MSWLERYQLGWLDPSQVHCVAEPDTVVVLGPLSRDGEDLRLAIVPVGPSQVIALEVEDTLYSPWGHGPPVFPSQAQGLLAYTVDAQDEFAQPIKLAGADDHRLIGRLPLMGVGEELTVWGHRITVLDETGGSYSVRIERLAESAHSSR